MKPSVRLKPGQTVRLYLHKSGILYPRIFFFPNTIAGLLSSSSYQNVKTKKSLFFPGFTFAPKNLCGFHPNRVVERGGKKTGDYLLSKYLFSYFFSGAITMADFSETSISRNAKRVYTAEIADVNTFNTLVQAFADDTTMEITKNRSSATYKTRIDYTDADGDENGYILVYGTSNDQLSDAVSLLTGNETTETLAGVGGSAAEADGEEYWAVKFSCTKNVTIGSKVHEDSFTVTIGKNYMLITGFAYDATLEALETWADTQDAMA